MRWLIGLLWLILALSEASAQMPADEAWTLVNADHAWGTKETVDFLSRCLRRVSTELPGAAKIYIGHISGKRGGHLSPHKSHQAGRDVDLLAMYAYLQTAPPRKTGER